jgi:hypothetical protein
MSKKQAFNLMNYILDKLNNIHEPIAFSYHVDLYSINKIEIWVHQNHNFYNEDYQNCYFYTVYRYNELKEITKKLDLIIDAIISDEISKIAEIMK